MALGGGLPQDRAEIVVVHLITGLDRGGAEATLRRVVERLEAPRFRCVVVSIKTPGSMAEDIARLGVAVYSLDVGGAADLARALPRLVTLLRRVRPDILQTWLYHADLLGMLAAPLARVPRLVWNVRNSDLGPADRLSWRLLVGLLARLSTRPDRVVVNAEAGRAAHAAAGYRPKRWAVIPNGFDTVRFRPRPAERAAVRAELGFGEDDFVIALPARYDRFKDHATFLRAARLVRPLGPVRFALMGHGVEPGNAALAAQIEAAGVADRLVLLGDRRDMPALLPAFDLVTLTSAYGEGVPNAIGEAMACERPVVATDVGDVRRLVGDAGLVVPPADPERLAAAWEQVIALTPADRAALGARARQRIADLFSIDREAAAYRALYGELASAPGEPRGVGQDAGPRRAVP